MGTFPNGIYSPSTFSNGDIFNAADINDPNSEIVAVEEALIGLGRGGPLDMHMDEDPGLDTALNTGGTYITYNASGDYLQVAANAGGSSIIRALYKSLPSILSDIVPDPTAVIELEFNFTIASQGGSTGTTIALIGLLDGTEATNIEQKVLGVEIKRSGSTTVISGAMGGASSGPSGPTLVASAATSTIYHVKLSWQKDRFLNLTGEVIDGSTGAQITAQTFAAIATAGDKDATLPHFGVRIYGTSTSHYVTLRFYDIAIRVIRK